MTEGRVDELWRSLARFPTRVELWTTLAACYGALGLPWQAGYAARQAFRLDVGTRDALDALRLGPWQDPSAGDARLGRATLARAPRLARRFRDRVAASPRDWLTWLYLARLEELPGRIEEGGPAIAPLGASDALRRAIACEPLPGESLHWLGVWRLNAGDSAGAVEALRGTLDVRPVRCGSMMYLGDALLRMGRVVAAEKAFARASLSANPDFLLALANRAYAHNYWQEAIEVLRKAQALRPASVAIGLTLARIQSEVYLLSDCRDSLRRVHALDPGNADARLLEAGLLGRMGDARAHLAALRAVYADGADPRSRLASSIAMTSLYVDTLAPAEIAALHRSLCAPIESAVVPRAAFANARTLGRRLRVGFVTGDLHRQHPVNLFMLPVLRRLDPARFDVGIYFTGTMHDEFTRRARACVARWLDAASLDDSALQRAIAADRIDLLVDLAGHTTTHRLGVFALRAAPVQATFLGYPHSTGLATIDWLIGDPIVAPAEHAPLFSEGLAQLPGPVFCWAAGDEHPLPPPRPRGGPVVFGSFNNAMKLSPTTLSMWAGVLDALPDARLLLKAPSLRDAGVQASLAQRFAEHGIAPDRLEFRGPSGLGDMMQEYGDIDIALDPTPYNGGTTTMQALWMGVPVVALAGGNFPSRMGASFLHALGRPDWVADDAAGYVAIATRLAREAAASRDNHDARAALRAHMAGSPLCDISAHVSHLQALFERMWRAYCRGERPRVLRADDG